jgi:hypothetical protein
VLDAMLLLVLCHLCVLQQQLQAWGKATVPAQLSPITNITQQGMSCISHMRLWLPAAAC